MTIEKYGYVPRDDKEMLAVRRINWDARDYKRGMKVKELEKYLEDLKRSGQKFQYHSTTNMKTREGKMKSEAYTCCMVRKGCKARLQVYKTLMSDVEENTVVSNGVHNHGMVFASNILPCTKQEPKL